MAISHKIRVVSVNVPVSQLRLSVAIRKAQWEVEILPGGGIGNHGRTRCSNIEIWQNYKDKLNCYPSLDTQILATLCICFTAVSFGANHAITSAILFAFQKGTDDRMAMSMEEASWLRKKTMWKMHLIDHHTYLHLKYSRITP